MKSLKEELRRLCALATGIALLQTSTWSSSFSLPSSAPGQDEAKSADEGSASKDEDQKEKDPKDKKEKDRYFALMGGDVYTGLGGVLRGASILSKNGIIEEIGFDLYLPEGTEQLDVSGMRVYPGMVALNAATQITAGSFSAEPGAGQAPGADPMDWDTHSGLDEHGFGDDPSAWGHVEPDTGDEDREHGTDDGPINAFDPDLASRIDDSFDPFSSFLVLSLATGITCVDQAGAAIKLKRDEIKDVLMKDGNLITLRWSIASPSSIRELKTKFAASAAHLRELREWRALSTEERKEKGMEKEPKKPREADDNALKILSGDSLARFNADEREELLGIARFAQQYSFKPVIFGCIEGWTVAEELGRAGAIAVVTPRARRPKSETLVRAGGSSIENAAKLHAAGVQVAIVPATTGFALQGMTGRDLLHLPTEAAFGVRGGLSESAAFAAISLIPARILGVDHRVGTLEKGKDMDAIVMDRDVLHYESFVQWAVVDGKLAYDKQAELYFAHIRPRPERPVAEEVEVPAEAPSIDAAGEADETEPAEEAEEEEAEEKPKDEKEDDGHSASA